MQAPPSQSDAPLTPGSPLTTSPITRTWGLGGRGHGEGVRTLGGCMWGWVSHLRAAVCLAPPPTPPLPGTPQDQRKLSQGQAPGAPAPPEMTAEGVGAASTPPPARSA